MVSLYAGGAPSQLVRATGSAGPVQGLLAFGSPLAGARLSTALPFSIRQQGGDGLAQLTLPGAPPPVPEGNDWIIRARRRRRR
jgi:hypothetical protein